MRFYVAVSSCVLVVAGYLEDLNVDDAVEPSQVFNVRCELRFTHAASSSGTISDVFFE